MTRVCAWCLSSTRKEFHAKARRKTQRLCGPCVPLCAFARNSETEPGLELDDAPRQAVCRETEIRSVSKYSVAVEVERRGVVDVEAVETVHAEVELRALAEAGDRG